MFEWWMELILIVPVFVVGYVTSWLMLRNNPKYLNVDKMIKEEMEKKRQEIIKAVQDKVSELK